MNDLKHIKELEKAVGFSLIQVDLENLFIDRSLQTPDEQCPHYYSVDENGFVTGLVIDSSLISLLPNNFLSNFSQLQKLKLKDTYPSDYAFLSELTSLTELDLSSNKLSDVSFLSTLSDISFLSELKSLTYLDLSSNKLSDVSFLSELKSLTWLNLRNNNLTNVSFLSELKFLDYLDLSSNNLTNASTLSKLTVLTYLDLRNNRLNDCSYVSGLKSLTKLDLSYNNLTNISFLSELTSLIWLDLGSNNLSDVSFLSELKSLTWLNLRNNNLTNVSFLNELESLAWLNLSSNNLTNVLISGELAFLRRLDLSSNNLTDVSFLSELKSLTWFNLRNNKLTNLTFLEELTSLTWLNLSSNNLTNISFLSELKSLTYLDLSFNNLTDVSFLGELKSLAWLDLKSNELTNLSFSDELISLTWLDISNNDLTDVSFLSELKSLYMLSLDTNPIIEPPIEIVKKGLDEIRNYLKQKEEQGTDYIYEAKVLIVGEPGAGKTTLFRKLQNHKYLPQEASEEEKKSTVGVTIETLEFPYNQNPEIPFKAYLWDFGGQKIQYILHQYFFTQRSLYVLLADDRRQLTNFHYWFEIIATLGVNCPVLVVLNERNHESVSNFDISEYKREFGNTLKSIAEKDVDFSNNTDGRFKLLDDLIKNELHILEHIGKGLPKTWVDIRKELQKIKKQRAYIRIDEFYKICRKHKVKNKLYQRQILGYFHDLGIALNYENDENLNEILILSPNWVIDSLYVVLKDKNVKDNCGKFSKEFVFYLWEKQGYKEEDCKTLLRLMQKGKFEVAYKLVNKNEYIVPALLPSISPEYTFDSTNALEIFFKYRFMPPGIVSRLIVRLQDNIVKQNDSQIVWEKGVLFKYEDSIAEIIESEYLKQIAIKVSGKNPIHNRDVVTIIRNEIRKIHSDWFENRLIFDELVPCICKTCKLDKDKCFYTLAELEKRIENGKETIECRKSYNDENVRKLLEGVYIENREEQKVLMKHKNKFNISTINAQTVNVVQGSEEVKIKQNIKGNNSDIEKKVDTMLSNLNETQAQEMEDLASEIASFFADRLDKLNDEQRERFESLKGSGLKGKMKLATPFIDYLGIGFEIEAEKEINPHAIVLGIRKILYGDEITALKILNS